MALQAIRLDVVAARLGRRALRRVALSLLSGVMALGGQSPAMAQSDAGMRWRAAMPDTPASRLLDMQPRGETPSPGTPPTVRPVVMQQPIGSAPDAFDEDLRPISQVGINTAPSAGELPSDLAGPIFQRQGYEFGNFAQRPWPGLVEQWVATNYCHNPLYFEDINLERYGYSWGCVLQPFVSAACFYGTAPLLPYKMTVEPQCSCVYTLGHFRPGSCAPRYCYRMPVRLDGALVQGGVITGLVFLLP